MLPICLLGDLRWDQEFGDERTRVVVGSTKLGPLPLDDVMVLELADDGRIARIRPHLRPWLTTTAFAAALAPAILRNPGVVRRALRK